MRHVQHLSTVEKPSHLRMGMMLRLAVNRYAHCTGTNSEVLFNLSRTLYIPEPSSVDSVSIFLLCNPCHHKDPPACLELSSWGARVTVCV